MANPPKRTARSDPESRRDDQPEDAAQKLTIVDLSNAWDQETQDCSVTRVLH